MMAERQEPKMFRGLTISDHALVRYIERVKGESLDAIRQEIADAISENRARRIPDSGYDDGLMFVLEIGTVITVLTPAYRPKRGKQWATRTMVHAPLPAPPPAEAE